MGNEASLQIAWIQILAPNRSHEDHSVTGARSSHIETLFIAQHREGRPVRRVSHHRQENDIAFRTLKRSAVAAQHRMALHQFFADRLRKLGANVVGLLRPNERDHANRSASALPAAQSTRQSPSTITSASARLILRCLSRIP